VDGYTLILEESFMSDNPLYAAPPSSLNLEQPPALGADSISNLSAPLGLRSGWVRFVGIMAIVGGGFNLLMVLLSGVVMLLFSRIPVFSAIPAPTFSISQAGSVIPNLITSGISIWTGILILQSADAIKRAYRNNDADAMMKSFSKLKTYFVIEGVIMALWLALAALMIIIILVFGAAITSLFSH
jgi:hypothetical protein